MTVLSVREATYFGLVLSAVAFSSAGSVAFGQEAAVTILVGAAGCLHDAIQSQEGPHNQLSHVRRAPRVCPRLTPELSRATKWRRLE